MTQRRPFAWAYIYENDAFGDTAPPTLSFHRRLVVFPPWREVPLFLGDDVDRDELRPFMEGR